MTMDELRAAALPHAQALEELATFSYNDSFAPWVTQALNVAAQFARMEAGILNQVREDMEQEDE